MILQRKGNNKNKKRKNIIKYFQVTEDMIIRAINKLDTKAAAGPDGIPAKLLKLCKGVLAEPLSIIWNASLK